MTSQIALPLSGATSCAFTPADLAAFEREMAVPFDQSQIVEPSPAERRSWRDEIDGAVVAASFLLACGFCGIVGFFMGRASVLAGGVL